MEILRKYWLSFTFGAIALIAVIAIFWPLGGKFDELQANLDKRKSLYQSLESLRSKPRQLPVVNVEDPTRQTLDQFPSQQIIDRGSKLIESVRAESVEMLNAAVELNRHKLLVEGALPQPRNTEHYAFRTQYREFMNKTLPFEILQAAIPPAQADVERAAKELWTNKYEKQIVVVNGQPTNVNEVTQQWQLEVAALPEKLRLDAAEKHKIYTTPNAFELNTNIPDAGQPEPFHIWFAQVGLWVQEDIVDALNAANAGATSVLDAPVKRLVKIDLIDQPGASLFVAPAQAGGAPGEFQPNGVAAPAAAAATKDFSMSPTGRISGGAGGLYDVVHFKLELVIDATQLPRVLEEIKRNRLMSIYQIDEIGIVSPESERALGYIYGSSPLIRVLLSGEALLLRNWSVPMMPLTVKMRMGIPQTPPPGTPS